MGPTLSHCNHKGGKVKKWLIILSMLVVGCSPKLTILGSHGEPIPHEMVMINSVKGITADFHFKRIYEESEESIYPEYLPLEEEIRIPRDTKELFLVLHIRNPEAVKLRVTKWVKVDGKMTTKIIYKGKAVDKVFQLEGPMVKGTKVELSATVEIDRRVVVLAGRALYRNP